MEMQQTKQVKIQDVQSKALDYLVAKCEGFGPDIYMRNIDIKLDVHGKCSQLSVPISRTYVRWSPSTEWAQGGPIIERQSLWVRESAVASPAIAHLVTPDKKWLAYAKQSHDGTAPHCYYGQTFLIAAMRCYVASKLGDVVDVPASLL